MNDSFKELLHTSPTCPFCGCAPVDARLIGLNAVVCEPCSENIYFHSAAYATIFADGTSIELWDYPAQAQAWRQAESTNAVFLEPNYTTSELTDSQQTAIAAFVTNTHRDVLSRRPLADIESKYLKTIRRGQTYGDSGSKEAQLKQSIDGPVILTSQHLYAPDPAALTAAQETQATLF
ncbi:hypothetical protein [Halorubrum sp. AJ67]|uniref:hypothetical protein n=1 Tax=Halorubrum sp. AJ67 TaxID=1173487 RepID=UPI0003DC7785|nr:hypothetical protein [Halorubrum sp. AJ67]CDK38082.1 hypothetical protein BN903_282 [Halorubrum sp. AJ67]